MESREYYPVKVTPSVKIRGYRPDVTGIKGMSVITVEAKIGFDKRSMMEAVTQAKVYSISSTHAYVAFPLRAWEKGDEGLKELCASLCKEDGIGIYLVDMNDETLNERLSAGISKFLDL